MQSCRTCHDASILIISTILPIYITMPTPFTYFMTTMPQIPRNRHTHTPYFFCKSSLCHTENYHKCGKTQPCILCKDSERWAQRQTETSFPIWLCRTAAYFRTNKDSERWVQRQTEITFLIWLCQATSYFRSYKDIKNEDVCHDNRHTSSTFYSIAQLR